jgi:hypothetical protein
MITQRDRRIFRRLARDIYNACGDTDLRTSYQQMFETDYATDWLRKDIAKVFEKYRDKNLSEEARQSLEHHEKTTLSSLPAYVQKRKQELGYDKNAKPRKPGKLINPFTVITGAGILAPVGIEIYCAVTGDPTPRETVYTWISKLVNDSGLFGEDKMMPPHYFTPAYKQFLTNELAGFLAGSGIGFVSDEIAKPITKKIRLRKQYKPLHRQVKQELGL